MAVSASFLAMLVDALGFVPGLRTRRMFGGAGVFSGEVMFGLAMDEALYLKMDGETEAAFAELGLPAFRYTDGRGVERDMSYRQAPDEIWEDPDVARDWIGKALGAAGRKKG